MGKLFGHIDQALEEFIRAQKMFFVATSPVDGAGRVNLSPKGLDTLRVLDPQTVAYMDYVGSGAETLRCGYGVPLYAFQGNRSQLADWAARKDSQGLHEYQAQKNRISIDGLHALRGPETTEPR